MSRTLFFLLSIKLLKEGLHCHFFTGPVVITSYKEEGLHYHLFTGQFVNYTRTL